MVVEIVECLAHLARIGLATAPVSRGQSFYTWRGGIGTAVRHVEGRGKPSFKMAETKVPVARPTGTETSKILKPKWIHGNENTVWPQSYEHMKCRLEHPELAECSTLHGVL